MLSHATGTKRSHRIAPMWQPRFVVNLVGGNRVVRESRKQV
jgi:hypothetical protein